MPKGSFTLSVEAAVERLWEILVDKVENPKKYVPGVTSSEILERSEAGLLRRLITPTQTIVEQIRINHQAMRIDSVFEEHPVFEGTTAKWITPPGGSEEWPLLTYELDWTPIDGSKLEDLTPVAMQGVKHTKKVAEET